ncbi:MAG TPA: hypothetical protein VNN72_22780 [Polyangiaceae bacterium]|nr:hypothetical protein [Polyangiaceae bacterium]
MAHTWKLAIGLGLLGASLTVGCVVKEGDDDDSGGAAGEGGSTGGSSAKGGTGGTTGGSAGKGGSSGGAGKGGSAGSGTGGSAGSAAGTGGSTGGTGGSSEAGAGDTGGSGGSGGDVIVPTCDPDSGDLPSHPYPTCDADPPGDECEQCIEESCCDFSKTCYGMEPYNVCGWGGPTEGPYAGLSEKGCFQACLSDKVKEADGECLQDDADTCGAECATPMCYEGAGQIALVGNATIDLTTCMQENCALKCFKAETCGN